MGERKVGSQSIPESYPFFGWLFFLLPLLPVVAMEEDNDDALDTLLDETFHLSFAFRCAALSGAARFSMVLMPLLRFDFECAISLVIRSLTLTMLISP